MVCDELDKSNRTGDFEHRETLLDVQTACRIAVEILNDLLCFDKLESGILELHKHEVPVQSFIADCVNMFGSQAREAGVTITNNSLIKNGQNNSTRCASNGWLEGDTVLMDKFKMDQVLRNLISNALKFTPRGGSVSVCASFVPDSGSLYRSSFNDTADKPPSVRNILHKFLNGFKIADSSIYDIESGTRDKDNQIVGKKPCDFNGCGALHGRPSTDGGPLDHVYNHASVGDALQLNSKIQSIDNEVTSGRLRIVVTDTGAGISEENLARLFKEIVQFNPEVLQAGGGSGLGLYITSSIVQMHGGTIRAYSEGAGCGSTFTVDIDMQLRRFHSLTSPLSGKKREAEHIILQQDPFSEHITGVTRQSLCAINQIEVSECADLLRSQSFTQQPCLSHLSDAVYSSPVSHMRLSPLVLSDTEYSPTVSHVRLSPLANEFSHTAASDRGDVRKGQEKTLALFPPPFHSIVRCVTAPDTASGVAYDILVVDDSSLNRKMLCRLLRTAGYTCDEANDGESAVEKVKARIESGIGGEMKGFYDAILMDFVMPVMDGPTATQAIRGLGYSDPIFGVTGNALDSDINYFIKCGASAVLIKPFDFDLFKRLMNENSQHASL